MAKTKQKTRASAKPAKVSARAKPVVKSKGAKPSKTAAKAPAKAPAKAKAKAAAKAPGKRAVVAKKPAAKKPAAPARKAVPVKARKPAVAASRKAPAKPVAKKAAAVKARPAKTPPPPKANTIKSSVIESKTARKSTSAGGAAVLKARAVPAPANDAGITMQDGRYALPATTRVDLPNGYRPSSKEEYMNPKHLEFFRRKLQGWREDLVEESKQTIENLRDEVRDVGDEAERATRETENSLELRTRDRYRKLIAKIDKALKRIEEGRYGFCEETDEEIGLDRLEARPIATLCLDAQERWEHRQKQMGD